MLCELIAKLKDDNGKVLVPGFYDDVEELTPREQEFFNKIPFDSTSYAQEIGAEGLLGEKGYSPLAQRWFRPTLECNGIFGGYTGEGAKTVIPSEATAKISMRLVSKQDPNKIYESFKEFVHSLCPEEARLSVIDHSRAFPVKVSLDSPALKAAQYAVEKAFGKEPLLQGEGGTVPVVAELQRRFGLESVLMGFNLPDDAIHAPNERFKLNHYHNGTLACAYFYDALGKKTLWSNE